MNNIEKNWEDAVAEKFSLYLNSDFQDSVPVGFCKNCQKIFSIDPQKWRQNFCPICKSHEFVVGTERSIRKNFLNSSGQKYFKKDE